MTNDEWLLAVDRSKQDPRLPPWAFVDDLEFGAGGWVLGKPCKKHPGGGATTGCLNCVPDNPCLAVVELNRIRCEHGLKPVRPLVDQKIEQLDLDGTLLATYDSVNIAMSLTEVKNILDVCRRVKDSAGGFRWRYAQR